MDWIEKLNKELKERRERNNTPEAKEEAKLRQTQWIASQGGYASLINGLQKINGKKSIKKLQQWQKDNDFRVCDLERTDEWKLNQSIALKKYYKENPFSNELKIQIGDKIRNNNSKLSNEERSKKFSNDSSSRKSLNMRTEILNMIETDTFTTKEARKACEEYGLGNWKAFLKDARIIKQIHKGTTGSNPSIYEKVK